MLPEKAIFVKTEMVMRMSNERSEQIGGQLTFYNRL